MNNFKISSRADEKYDSGRGFSFWRQFIFLALCGQLCRNVENQWFNTFLYRKITQDVNYVTAMVIISATLTCISTYLFGTISDRLGKRKVLTGFGFIARGISTIVVGSTEFIAEDKTASAIVLAAVLVVVFDAIMSFIGSIAYDSSFNVWVNDHTTEKNKDKVGSILGIMPVFATIFGTVVGGAIIGTEQNYQTLFRSMGVFVILGGILTLIFVKDKNDLKSNKDGSFWHQLTNAFRFKKLAKMPNFKEMILACLVICVYYISFNFYFAHLGNRAIYALGFNEMQFGIVEGLAMILSIVLAIPLSKLITKDKIPLVCLIGLVASYIGLMMIYFFVRSSADVDSSNAFGVKNIILIVSCFFFGTGEILLTEACMIWVRGLFPEKNRGQFEGMRSVFFVWLPMLVGTLIGGWIIKMTGSNATDSYGMAVDIPTNDLFFWSSFVVLATLIPLFFATRLYRKRIKAKRIALAKGIVDPTLFDAIPVEENNVIKKANDSEEFSASKMIRRDDKVEIFDELGNLINVGYSFKMNFLYDYKQVKAKEERIKEWDFYQFTNGERVIQLTIGHASLFDNYSVNIFNIIDERCYSISKVRLHRKGKIAYENDPDSPHELLVKIKNFAMSFIVSPSSIALKVGGQNKKYGLFSLEVNVKKDPSADKIAILTPFYESKKMFYLNFKENYYEADAEIKMKDLLLKLDNLNGVLDFGRGYRPRDNEWYWSSLAAKVDEHTIAWNLGWGFGDLSKTSENMFFIDGKGIKLGRIKYNASSDDPKSATIEISDDSNKLKAKLVPIYDNYTKTKVFSIDNECHQVFYRASGSYKDKNNDMDFVDIVCFLEHAKNHR